jgi:hypothetical protein
MKIMRKFIVMLLLLSVITTMVGAQNLSSIPERERTEKLVKAAKEAIQKYAPDYYRYTNGSYKIESGEKDTSPEIKELMYSVIFVDYNNEEEFFRNGYAISVNFREIDGSIQAVVGGQGWGIIIPQEPLTRSQKVPKLEYKRVPPYKPNPDPRGPQKVY